MHSNGKIKHLAIIMDGNARWAKAKKLDSKDGHKKGAEVARKLSLELKELQIPYVTFYAFSSENWGRPEEEVSFLMSLLAYYIEHELKALHKNDIKLKVIGNQDNLNPLMRKKIHDAVELTKHNTSMTIVIALGYGGKLEIVDACQKIIDSGIKQITPEIFQQYLYDPEMPDVDLMIRPGGDYRISNFLLWQSAYAELYFTQKLWPDFTIDDIKDAMEDFSCRVRTFGGK